MNFGTAISLRAGLTFGNTRASGKGRIPFRDWLVPSCLSLSHWLFYKGYARARAGKGMRGSGWWWEGEKRRDVVFLLSFPPSHHPLLHQSPPVDSRSLQRPSDDCGRVSFREESFSRLCCSGAHAHPGHPKRETSSSPVLFNVFDEKSPPFRRPRDQKTEALGTRMNVRLLAGYKANREFLILLDCKQSLFSSKTVGKNAKPWGKERLLAVYHFASSLCKISNTRNSVSSGYANTEKRVENTTRSRVFLTKFEVLG